VSVLCYHILDLAAVETLVLLYNLISYFKNRKDASKNLADLLRRRRESQGIRAGFLSNEFHLLGPFFQISAELSRRTNIKES